MVVVAILGGLGNQMFQYAAARALAEKKNEKLLVDLSGFDSYSLHQGYELARVFGLQLEVASPTLVQDQFGWRTNSIARKILKRPFFGCMRGSHMAFEPHFNYWPGLYQMRSPIYLLGYWQSERYFADSIRTIRAEFQFGPGAGERNERIQSFIKASNSVSVHVRRGDYVKSRNGSQVLEPCGIDYYRAAAQEILKKIRKPNFYIFSDDIEWARQNLNFLPCPTYVEHNTGLESYQDMRLMSSCEHHIIANSSFSWWAAWLNPNPDKIVIAPRVWFTKNLPDEDLIPPQWLRL
jgi:hypothetical protein